MNNSKGGYTMFRRVKETATVIVLAALILSVALVAPPLAPAQELAPVTIVDAGGQVIMTDPPPFIIENRTMVPITALAGILQGKAVWEADQLTVIVTRGKDVMRIRVDSDQAKISGRSLSLGVPACIVSERVCVPLRSVAEAFGAKVDWNDATRTVTITPRPETVKP